MQGDIAPPQLPRVKMDRAYFTRKFTPMTDDEFKQEIAAENFESHSIWQRMCAAARSFRSPQERRRIMIAEYLKDSDDDKAGGPGVMSQWDEDGAVVCLCTAHRLERCTRCFYDFVDMNASARAEARMEKQQLCGNNCKRPGILACTCNKVRYCSESCQQQNWQQHRSTGCTGVFIPRQIPTTTRRDRPLMELPVGARLRLKQERVNALIAEGRRLSEKELTLVIVKLNSCSLDKYNRTHDDDDLPSYTIKYDSSSTACTIPEIGRAHV